MARIRGLVRVVILPMMDLVNSITDGISRITISALYLSKSNLRMRVQERSYTENCTGTRRKRDLIRRNAPGELKKLNLQKLLLAKAIMKTDQLHSLWLNVVGYRRVSKYPLLVESEITEIILILITGMYRNLIIMVRNFLLVCIAFQLLACQSSTQIYALVDLRNENKMYGTQEGISHLHKKISERSTDGQIVIIKSPFPEYPQDLLDAGIEGTVIIDFTVNKKGKVVEPLIVQSQGEEFDKASLASIKRWRFQPILKDGKPVDARLRQSFEFRLE
jgi:TonB family protein